MPFRSEDSVWWVCAQRLPLPRRLIASLTGRKSYVFEICFDGLDLFSFDISFERLYLPGYMYVDVL